MKFLDNRGKLFGKISIVDLFVVLLIIACVGAVGLKFKAAKTVSGGDRTITYEVKVESIREVSVDAIDQYREGLIDAESKKDIGNVVDVTTSPARVLAQKNDGNYTYVEYDNRYDTVVTIQSSGTETDDGYFTASGRQISVGDTININNGVSQYFGEIIKVAVE